MTTLPLDVNYSDGITNVTVVTTTVRSGDLDNDKNGTSVRMKITIGNAISLVLMIHLQMLHYSRPDPVGETRGS